MKTLEKPETILRMGSNSAADSLEGWTIWFFAILTIAAVASAFPAWNAARQPVNEVLAYE